MDNPGEHQRPAMPTGVTTGGSDADAEAFRSFALAVYQIDDVAKSCLLLQESAGVDVTVMLFAAYAGAMRHARVSVDEITALRCRVRPWHDEVVRPLRAIRQRLKTGPAPAPSRPTEQLRDRVKRAELEAELLEIDTLGRMIDLLNSRVVGGDPIVLAGAGIEAVLVEAGRPPDDLLRPAITSVAQAAARHAGRHQREDTCAD